MTHIIKMQNMSSGDVVVFQNTFIQNYSFKRNVNWDTTNTIGRMDPVKTYKNTETKLDLSFTVINPHQNIGKYTFISTTDSLVPNEIEEFFKNTKMEMGDVVHGIYSYYNNNDIFGKLLYPSYDSDSPENGAWYMKSAPVLRVRVYLSNKPENIIFDGYATTNAFDVNLKAEDSSSPGGRNFSSCEFSILLDVLHTEEYRVSSLQSYPVVEEADVLAGGGSSAAAKLAQFNMSQKLFEALIRPVGSNTED